MTDKTFYKLVKVCASLMVLSLVYLIGYNAGDLSGQEITLKFHPQCKQAQQQPVYPDTLETPTQ